MTVGHLINYRFVGEGVGGGATGYLRHHRKRHFLAALSTTVLTDGSLLRDKAAVLRHSTKGAFCIYCTAHEELSSRWRSTEGSRFTAWTKNECAYLLYVQCKGRTPWDKSTLLWNATTVHCHRASILRYSSSVLCDSTLRRWEMWLPYHTGTSRPTDGCPEVFRLLDIWLLATLLNLQALDPLQHWIWWEHVRET